MLGVGWGRRTTHLAFGEVAGAEGSFYPLAVSREHLEKTESRESESCSVVSDSLQPHGLYSPWNSPGQNTGVGSLSLLRGIFPTQGSNPGLLHFRQILYQLRKASGKEGVSGLEREGLEELGGGEGRMRGEGIGETHFFTGIFPSGLSCILSFTRLVGRKQPVRAQSCTLNPACTKARQVGTYILSRKVLREALAVSGCLARASTSSAQSCRTPEHSGQVPHPRGATTPHSPGLSPRISGQSPGPRPEPPTHLAHVVLIGDEVMEGEVHHVRAGYHCERLQQEVVGDVHVEDFPELLALQQVVTQWGSAVCPWPSAPWLPCLSFSAT